MSVVVNGIEMPDQCEHCLIARKYKVVDEVEPGQFVAVHALPESCKLGPDYCLRSKVRPDKKTNSDHIRSMTDEELAKFLLNISGRSPGIMPTGGWLEWLNRECK